MPGGLYYALIVLADPTIVVPLPQYFQAASSIVSRLSTPSKSPDAMVKCDGLWTQLFEINVSASDDVLVVSLICCTA
ncbi:uncharacterized protein C8Q71DRAFT_784120 [Rhodofomes roseus]|uniref:Secreted protein n=1 Tax=Rhodofomes roseus TaxID=34475 RepID=A0ABQ8K3T5_9APHY|nr:uncharacterized protein C8Q71DRAFT_784120 [Rhodofomes roseus]KAH9831029.1 hypothetical protein C8Q71DRAFT_784120 [Rhodofomes roseus]